MVLYLLFIWCGKSGQAWALSDLIACARSSLSVARSNQYQWRCSKITLWLDLVANPRKIDLHFLCQSSRAEYCTYLHRAYVEDYLNLWNFSNASWSEDIYYSFNTQNTYSRVPTVFVEYLPAVTLLQRIRPARKTHDSINTYSKRSVPRHLGTGSFEPRWMDLQPSERMIGRDSFAKSDYGLRMSRVHTSSEYCKRLWHWSMTVAEHRKHSGYRSKFYLIHYLQFGSTLIRDQSALGPCLGHKRFWSTNRSSIYLPSNPGWWQAKGAACFNEGRKRQRSSWKSRHVMREVQLHVSCS